MIFPHKFFHHHKDPSCGPFVATRTSILFPPPPQPLATTNLYFYDFVI